MASWMKRATAVVMVFLVTVAAAATVSPIADAAMEGDLEAIRELIRGGGDVNEAQADGMTALHWAADRGDVELALLLLEAGADPSAVTRIGAHTPVLVAARRGHDAVLQTLLEAGADPNARTSTAGTSALHFAAAAGTPDAVRLLVEHGADVNAREASHEHTPLMFAAAANHAETIRTLLEAGADPDLTNRVDDMAAISQEDSRLQQQRNERVQWERARDEAIARGEEVPEEPVFEEPAPAEQPRQQEEGSVLGYAGLIGKYGGFTAAHLAARDGQREAMDALMAGGADINKQSGDGSTPLLVATINGHWDLAMHLLDMGADPNIASNAGATPLYGVINLQWIPHAFYPQPSNQQSQQVGYLEAMEKLLEAGADPNVRLTRHLWYKTYNFNLLGVDTQGATPFWRAAYGTDVPAMRLLLEHGADPTLGTIAPQPRRRRSDDDEEEEEEVDPSGLPPVAPGEPSLTPLHAATGAGYGLGRAGNQHRHLPGGWMPATRFLVEEVGLDVNARDHQGYTPLHNAAARGDTEMIQYLVDQGADVTVVSRRGQTTADMANGPVQRITPFPAAIRLLEELGSHNNDNCQSC